MKLLLGLCLLLPALAFAQKEIYCSEAKGELLQPTTSLEFRITIKRHRSGGVSVPADSTTSLSRVVEMYNPYFPDGIRRMAVTEAELDCSDADVPFHRKKPIVCTGQFFGSPVTVTVVLPGKTATVQFGESGSDSVRLNCAL